MGEARACCPYSGRVDEQAQYFGAGIGEGIVTGPAVWFRRPRVDAQTTAEAREGDGLGDIREALEHVSTQLTARRAGAPAAIAALIDGQLALVNDPTLLEEAAARMREGTSPAAALAASFDEFIDEFEALGGIVAERAVELRDLKHRALASLNGDRVIPLPNPGHPHILLARDIPPSAAVDLDPEQVLGLVTLEGSQTSHIAIIANELGIPAVVGAARAREVRDGAKLRLDASEGVVEPAPEDARVSAPRPRPREPEPVGGPTPAVLADGTEIELLANVASMSHVTRARELGAQGIGLLRTELLIQSEGLLTGDAAPSREVQRVCYERAFAEMPGAKFLVRLFDAGSDKPLPFLGVRGEMNPALGVRGVRALLAREEILRDQLEALAEAERNSGAELWVSAPMLSTPAELHRVRGIAEEAGIQRLGSMLETPAGALTAQDFLADSAFISIGTNDLVQHTIAVDRTNADLHPLQLHDHPAVLAMIQHIQEVSDEAGVPVSVCGESARNPELAILLVGLGIRSLSMAPSALAKVREQLTGLRLEDAEAAAQRALGTLANYL